MPLDEFMSPDELLDLLLDLVDKFPGSMYDESADNGLGGYAYESVFLSVMEDHRDWQCGDEWVPSDTDLARMKSIYRSFENASCSN